MDCQICLSIGLIGENHIGCPSHLSDARGEDGAMRGHLFRLDLSSIVSREMVALVEQAACDPAAHVAQSNESEFHLIWSERVHVISVWFVPGLSPALPDARTRHDQ